MRQARSKQAGALRPDQTKSYIGRIFHGPWSMFLTGRISRNRKPGDSWYEISFFERGPCRRRSEDMERERGMRTDSNHGPWPCSMLAPARRTKSIPRVPDTSRCSERTEGRFSNLLSPTFFLWPSFSNLLSPTFFENTQKLTKTSQNEYETNAKSVKR